MKGPLGCGKTTVLGTVAEHAVDRGFRVLRAACAHQERELQFGMMAQLFQAAGLVMDLPTPADDAQDGYVGMASTDDAAIVRLCHRLCLKLIEAAEHQPSLIVIDDLRHADVPSAMCLAQLIRRVNQVPIMIMVSDDLNLGSFYPPLRAELAHIPGAGRIELGPLAPDVVTDFLAQRFDMEIQGTYAAEFYEATGGNPLLVQALAEDYSCFGDTREQGYGQAFVSYLNRNEPILLGTARALAVLDADVPTAELARVAGAGPAMVGQALHAMNEAGLLNGHAFRHEAARLSVVNELPADLRADLHRRVAELLHDQGMPVVTIARHLVSAGDVNVAWSQDVLLEAADLVSFAGDAGFAIELLERAMLSSTDPRERAAVETRLAETKWRVNPSAAARHLGPLVEAARAGHLEVSETINLVRHLVWRGRIGEAEQLLDRLWDSPEITDELYSLDQWLKCTYPLLARRGVRPPADRDPKKARPGGLTRASAVLADLLLRGPSQDTGTRAEEVLRELHLGHHITGQEEEGLLAVLALIYTDQLDIANSWCDDLLQGTAPRPLPVWRALLTACKAEIAVRRGDNSEAVGLATKALTDMTPGSWATAVGLPLGCLVLAYTRMGRFDDAARYANQSIPSAMLKSRYGLHYLYARGHYFLATDRRQSALADFLLCGESIDGWGLSGGVLVPWRTSAAEAWLSLGNQDQAKRLVLEQLSRPGADGGRVRALSLRLLAEISSTRRRAQLLTEAIDVLERCGDKYELARALRDLSRAWHATGEHNQARGVVRRAWYMAKRCDAEPLCEELSPKGGDDVASTAVSVVSESRIELLTHSERRVASLAAMGYTNREIAGRLYVTASTVEQHLTRVFRKLDVRRRDELPDQLGIWTP